VRIVTAPLFATDGTLLFRTGYSATAKLYLDINDDFDLAPVPEKPLVEDVKFAKETIDDLLGDFPFISDAERTHAVVAMLQPFARELISGPTPLLLIDKPTPGTGAGLLCDVVTSVFLGHAPAMMTAARDEDEWRKRILALLLHGNSVIVIDNVRNRLDAAALSSVITSEKHTERLLGTNAMVVVENKAMWLATGNNVALSNEMSRRTVRIRMDPKVDRPWQRAGFKYPNLRRYASEQRLKLVWCCLVLIQDWIARGKVEWTGKALGSFDSWTKVMGGIVESAGYNEFLGNLEELYEESDAEGNAWRQFVAGWWEQYGDSEVGVSDLYSVIVPGTGDPLDIHAYLGDGNEKSQKTRLGKLLPKYRDRHFEGKRIIRASHTLHHAQLWQLKYAV
jgi:putative DNA primase/helicase